MRNIIAPLLFIISIVFALNGVSANANTFEINEHDSGMLVLDLTKNSGAIANLDICKGSIRADIDNDYITLKINNSACSKLSVTSTSSYKNQRMGSKILDRGSNGFSGTMMIINEFYDHHLGGTVVHLNAPQLADQLILIRYEQI